MEGSRVVVIERRGLQTNSATVPRWGKGAGWEWEEDGYGEILTTLPSDFSSEGFGSLSNAFFINEISIPAIYSSQLIQMKKEDEGKQGKYGKKRNDQR